MSIFKNRLLKLIILLNLFAAGCTSSVPAETAQDNEVKEEAAAVNEEAAETEVSETGDHGTGSGSRTGILDEKKRSGGSVL